MRSRDVSVQEILIAADIAAIEDCRVSYSNRTVVIRDRH